MTDNTQNPGGWPDAEEERLWALAPAHLRVLVDRRIAAREAAARREGMEACMAIARERGAWASNDTDADNLKDRLEANGRMDMASEIAAAIRALLEGGR